MESLNRNNYETWFLDYLDGQLSNEQLDTLLEFLEANPDLKEELRGMSAISLSAGTESLDSRDMLLKGPDDIPGIAAVDQLCIARMENDLPEAEAIQFDQRLSEDESLRERYHAFSLTRLVPVISEVYPDKKELTRGTRFFSPWFLTAVSAAAVLVLVWILWPKQAVMVTPEMAKLDKPASGSTQVAAPIPQTGTAVLKPAATVRVQPSVAGKARQLPVKAESPVRESMPMNALTPKSISGPHIPDPLAAKVLYASNFSPAGAVNIGADDRLTLPQYALQLFRERILGEDRKVVRKTRFSMWEVAGAGVSKINMLAGTKMRLSREYDSNGDLMAVSFNSRLIDVEAPVRSQDGR
jgi:hypothetical protein